MGVHRYLRVQGCVFGAANVKAPGRVAVPMSRITALTWTGLLISVSLLGLAPTAASEVCVPIFPDGEFEFGVCGDPSSDECAVWTYSRFSEPCYVAPIGPVCVPIIPRGEFMYGVCADTPGSGCVLWTYSRFGEQCYAA